jgi:hypothetical protein
MANPQILSSIFPPNVVSFFEAIKDEAIVEDDERRLEVRAYCYSESESSGHRAGLKASDPLRALTEG